MKISYRKLVSEDSMQYREIRLESLKAHPESFGSTFEEQTKLPKLMFEKALEQPVDERFVIGAFDQKELIGICGFVPFVLDNHLDLRNAGMLIQMYVRAEYRGRQIGQKLVQITIREAFKIPDIEQIVLGVRAGNRSAIRVYEQTGFQMHNLEANQDDFRMMVIHRDN